MRIGIVNDLPLAAEALRRAVALKPQHQVAWGAYDGAQAVAMCAKETPDLILMDLIMPGMGGVEATRRIMASTPCAILVVTVSVGANSRRVFEAMGYGALDAVDTPVLDPSDPRASSGELLSKIETIGNLVRIRNAAPRIAGQSVAVSPGPAQTQLVAIGASAGGPAAVATVLADLPADFPAAVVVIQHVDARFASGMAEWLGETSRLPVRVAREGERAEAGTVLVAGTNDHLILKSADRLGYTSKPSDYAYRPSVDVFFQSVTQHWPGNVVGVLLTGMGRDGAHGLKALRDKGHYTIAQDQASSAVYGMPKAAASLGAAVDILPIERIAPSVTAAVVRKI